MPRWPEQQPVTEKPCARCKAVKPTSEFYPDKVRKDGFHCYCKPCAREKSLRWRYAKPENTAKIQECNRRWYANNHDRQMATNARTRARQPEKVYARRAMNNAVRAGKLVRRPCEKCGDPKSQGHHDDYAKPLDVHWMCRRCHWAEHRKSAEGLAAVERGY